MGAKRKRKKQGAVVAAARGPTGHRLGKMSIGCVLLIVLVALFLIVPRLAAN